MESRKEETFMGVMHDAVVQELEVLIPPAALTPQQPINASTPSPLATAPAPMAAAMAQTMLLLNARLAIL